MQIHYLQWSRSRREGELLPGRDGGQRLIIEESSTNRVPRQLLLVESVPRSHQIPLLSLHNNFKIYNLEK